MYYKLKRESFAKRVSAMAKMREEARKNVEDLHVYVSDGNAKMGSVPSISLLPVVDCANCHRCATSCYDLRSDMIKKDCLTSRVRNSVIYEADAERFFKEIEAYLTYRDPPAFRWHVGGDIKNASYLEAMCEIARLHKRTEFLAFTKNFKVVNERIDAGLEIPQNLHLIFSGWLGLKMDNPHNMPTSHPIFPNGETSAPDGAKLCTGNCTDCLVRQELCWVLKSGEAVVFPAH